MTHVGACLIPAMVDPTLEGTGPNLEAAPTHHGETHSEAGWTDYAAAGLTHVEAASIHYGGTHAEGGWTHHAAAGLNHVEAGQTHADAGWAPAEAAGRGWNHARAG